MTLTTPLPRAWAHLPNAVHIDRVLASLDEHSDQWTAVQTAAETVVQTAAEAAAQTASRGVAETAAQTAAQTASRGAAWSSAWSTAWSTAWSASRGAAWPALWSSISALVAWDDCAYMLDLPDDKLKELREAGNHPAMLLSAAASVLRETK